jgi:hypothetical protein
MRAQLVNGKAIENALVKAFEDWAREDVNDAHWDDQFRDMDQWDWPNETVRRNRQVVDSPRDIYDLGDLYKSGVESFMLTTTRNAATASWQWNEYGYYVHYGTRFMPGREFTSDISIAASFLRKPVGKAFMLRLHEAFGSISAA